MLTPLAPQVAQPRQGLKPQLITHLMGKRCRITRSKRAIKFTHKLLMLWNKDLVRCIRKMVRINNLRLRISRLRTVHTIWWKDSLSRWSYVKLIMTTITSSLSRLLSKSICVSTWCQTAGTLLKISSRLILTHNGLTWMKTTISQLTWQRFVESKVEILKAILKETKTS